MWCGMSGSCFEENTECITELVLGVYVPTCTCIIPVYVIAVGVCGVCVSKGEDSYVNYTYM